MPETTLPQTEMPQAPTPEQIQLWMKDVNDRLDSPILVPTQDGEPTVWHLYDAVYDRSTPERDAVAILIDASGEKQTLPVRELLQFPGQTPIEIGEAAVAQEVITQPDVLQAAKNIFNEFGNSIVGGMLDPRLDELIDEMSPQERTDFEQWQVEHAAVRAPKLFEIIAQSPQTPGGMYKIPEDLAEDFEAQLTLNGASKEAPTKDQIATGVKRAKSIIETGKAAQTLSAEPFMDNYDFQKLTRNAKMIPVIFPGTMYVDPSLIKGADGHDSWAGRGTMGNDSVGIREMNRPDGKTGTRPSIDQIEDYAARETQLPPVVFDLILTKDGPIYYSTNAHRASAAKLRGEPLGFSSLNIFDAR